MKKLLILLIALICLTGAALAEEDDPWEGMDRVFVLCQPDSYVTVRSSPKKAYNEIGYGWAGNEYYTDWKERNGYLHIYGTFEAGEGWIKKNYVSIWEPEIYPEGKTFTVAVKKVNCRQYIGGRRKGTLKKGAEVTVWVESAEWCVTNRGYIRTEYLEEKP